MNLLKSPMRRAVAVLASAFIGMTGAVALTAAPASAHKPFVSGATDCVKDGKWTVNWSVGNDYKLDAQVKLLTVLGGKDLTVTGDLAADGKVIPPHSAQQPDQRVDGATEVTDAEVRFVKLLVKLEWTDGYKKSGYALVHKPADCAPEQPPTEQPPTEQPQPTPIVEVDCSTIVLGLDNTKGDKDVTLTFETSKGEKRTLEVKAGKKETTKFSAGEGFSVKVGAKGTEETTTVKWAKPAGEECSGSGGGSGSLPVTGAAAGSIAGGAAVLLVAGITMFFVARRRKLKFTA